MNVKEQSLQQSTRSVTGNWNRPLLFLYLILLQIFYIGYELLQFRCHAKSISNYLSFSSCKRKLLEWANQYPGTIDPLVPVRRGSLLRELTLTPTSSTFYDNQHMVSFSYKQFFNELGAAVNVTSTRVPKWDDEEDVLIACLSFHLPLFLLHLLFEWASRMRGILQPLYQPPSWLGRTFFFGTFAGWCIMYGTSHEIFALQYWPPPTLSECISNGSSWHPIWPVKVCDLPFVLSFPTACCCFPLF